MAMVLSVLPLRSLPRVGKSSFVMGPAWWERFPSSLLAGFWRICVPVREGRVGAAGVEGFELDLEGGGRGGGAVERL
jgi:hypothetical protein